MSELAPNEPSIAAAGADPGRRIGLRCLPRQHCGAPCASGATVGFAIENNDGTCWQSLGDAAARVIAKVRQP
jgi:hypothetical protein